MASNIELHSIDSHRYIRTPMRGSAVDENLVILYSAFSKNAVVASKADARILAACRSWKTLDDHTRDLAARGGLGDIKRRLEALRGTGLLISQEEIIGLYADIPGISAGTPAIEWITIPTKDRPLELK